MHPGHALIVPLASLANFVVVADATIVTVALPSIGAALHLSATGLPWVVNAYSLAFAGCLVLGGYAADRLGPRVLFGAGMALFALGSAACAVAGTGTALLAGRVVQGLGGALFSPAALAAVTASAPPGQRDRALAAWSASGAAAVALGPAAGGTLTGVLGWPSVFWVPAAACLAAAVAGLRLLPRRSGDGPGRREAGPGGPAGPMFPTAQVLTASAVLALAAGAVAGATYLCTLWVQDVLHLDPLRAGAVLMSLSVGIVAGALSAPALTQRLGGRRVALTGLAVAALGMLLLVPTPVRVPMAMLVPALAVLGVGFGLQSVPVCALATAVPRRRGLASAAYQTAGQLGGGLGVLLLASVASSRSAALPVAGDPALVAGYHTALAAGAAVLVLAALVAAGVRRREDVPPAP